MPKSEDEKTYLVFIGLGGEEGILELIPGPEVDISRDLEISGLHAGGEETARYLVGEEEEKAEDTLPHRIRTGEFPDRIQIRYVPQDEDVDDVYDNEGKYDNRNLDEEVESEANADKWLVESSPPLFQMQHGTNVGVRTWRKLGFKTPTQGYHVAHDGEEELGEITGNEFAEQLSQLPPNLSQESDNMGSEDGEAISSNIKDKTGLDKLIASQDLPDGVEEKYHIINDSRCDSDHVIQEQKKPNEIINDKRSARFPASERVLRSIQLPVPILQEKAEPPVPDETSCTNSSPTSPRLQFEAVGEPGNADKEDGGSDERKESDESTSDEKKVLRKAILERRKFEFHSVEEQQQMCQSKLQVLEPRSPISPRPDEISPLTTPSNSSPNINPNEGDLAEGDEDETPPYPAKTIQNLIATEHVKIVYLEDLEALHGFLEAMMFSRTVSTRNPPLLAIWGLVGAHYQTNYFGGEGIGETVARAVETAAKSGRLLVLGEGYILVDYGNGEDEIQEQCWVDLEVPILNMGSMAVGRTVEVRQILRRWCRFGEDLEDSEDEEEIEEGEYNNEDEDEDEDDDDDGNSDGDEDGDV